MNHEILIPEVEAEALAAEGKIEREQVESEIAAAYEKRIEETKEKPKTEKRLIILNMSPKDDKAVVSITLGDERIGANNSETYSPALNDQELPTDFANISGVIFSGSSANIENKDEFPWIEKVEEYMRQLLAHDVPVLGICFGMQLYADMNGREVPKNLGGAEAGFWKTSVFMDAKMTENEFFDGFDFQTDEKRDAEGQVIEEAKNASMVITTSGLHNYRVGYSTEQTQGIQGYSYPPNLFDFENFDPAYVADKDGTPKEAYPMVEIKDNFYGVQFHPELDTDLKIRANLATKKIQAPRRLKEGADMDTIHGIVEGVAQHLEDTRAGKTEGARSNMFLKNFLDICEVK